jgi:hypothetical protein
MSSDFLEEHRSEDGFLHLLTMYLLSKLQQHPESFGPARYGLVVRRLKKILIKTSWAFLDTLDS